MNFIFGEAGFFHELPADLDIGLAPKGHSGEFEARVVVVEGPKEAFFPKGATPQ